MNNCNLQCKIKFQYYKINSHEKMNSSKIFFILSFSEFRSVASYYIMMVKRFKLCLHVGGKYHYIRTYVRNDFERIISGYQANPMIPHANLPPALPVLRLAIHN